jgi:hypothetical protein
MTSAEKELQQGLPRPRVNDVFARAFLSAFEQTGDLIA